MAKTRLPVHIRPTGTVTENARRILRARLAELSVWAQYAHDPDRPREQHQLRIASKRLRYTLELFRDFLPEQAGEAIKELKGLQDALGLMHDCDVLLAILRSALFMPNEDTALFDALPEARDLPLALLEVLGQPAPESALPPEASNHHQGKLEKEKKSGKGRKDHPKADKRARTSKQKKSQQIAVTTRSKVRPNAEQRAALEAFLRAKQAERDQLYAQFVKRWDKMEARNFRAAMLHLVEGAETAGHVQVHPDAAGHTLKKAAQP